MPKPIKEQRAKVEIILNIDKEKPKTILGISLEKYTENNIYKAAYRQLVFIYKMNFKPFSNKNNKILELAKKAVNSK